MKAKKLIAVGLAAAMTVGMTISAFADVPDFDKDAPQFNNWDTDIGVNDNAFHLKGQGWLESGAGINESVTNVIVPTVPNLNLGYGHPGLFDFGIDPQRLVKRTDEARYDTENFTTAALDSGVYFLNTPLIVGEEEKNTYDNKSIKLVGKNIGTEPVGFTVKATLENGVGFNYLEDAPYYETADESFDLLWETLGYVWMRYVTENVGYGEGDANMIRFAQDLAASDLRYNFNEVFTTDTDPSGLYNYTLETTFVKYGTTKPLSAQNVLSAVTKKGFEGLETEEAKEKALKKRLSDYWLVKTEVTDLGMYLSLNTALGEEGFDDDDYAEEADETAFKVTEGIPSATVTQRVEGSPENYEMSHIEALDEYKKTMKDADDRDPFKTVAFWFRGVSTLNSEVGENVKPPALTFTWSFSKTDVPEAPEEPVVAPKLMAINGNDVPGDFNGEFTIADCVDGGIALTFDHEVDRIERINGENWMTVPEETVREIIGNTVIFKQSYIEIMPADRTFRVVCTEGYSDSEPGYSDSFIIKKSAD